MSEQKQGPEVTGRRLVWSALHNLADWKSAPTEDGIYVIGIYNGAADRPATGLPCTDEYLGANWPDDFTGKLVGRAYKTTLRGRLKDHFERSSNKHVRAYLKENGDHSLSYIYIPKCQFPSILDPRYAEHAFLSAMEWPWNIHTHEEKSFTASIRDWLKDDPPSDLATWWDPHDG